MPRARFFHDPQVLAVLALAFLILFTLVAISLPTTQPIPPTPNYRAIIANHVRATFSNPDSIRDALIAPPKMMAGAPSLNTDGRVYTPWVVCLHANARITALALSGRRVVNSWDEAQSRALCADAVYERLPEVWRR